jgi:hypothetical protein
MGCPFTNVPFMLPKSMIRTVSPGKAVTRA